MKTTRKQLINYAIALIKEVAKSEKDIKIEYQNKTVNVWIYNKDLTDAEYISFYIFDNTETNKQKFSDCILKIRGIKL